jgi:SAM-dependent methyltransferase
MHDWTAGYVTDIGYTYGYYPVLNPLRIKLAFLHANLASAPVATACELGFGQGVSTNIHAAGSNTAWYGNDFNPAQAAFASDMAAASGARALLTEDNFEDFCSRSDLPDFDFIAMHGIWSWVSEANRAIIVGFLGRKLKPGGVLYVSYNTQAGWAAMVPVRELLTDHAAVMGAPGQGVVQRVDEAIAFAGKLLAADPMFARANPQVIERLAELKDKDRAYIAHEYFNRDWTPVSFASMARTLADAKLSYACSADYIDQIPGLNLTPAQQALLAEIKDPVFRESVRDFCTNIQFRRDYWVKGPRQLTPLKRAEGLKEHRLQLVQPRSLVTLTAKGALGEVNLNAEVYGPLLDLFADYQPRTIQEVCRVLVSPKLPEDQVLQSLLLLVGNGILDHVQDDARIARARSACDKLNLHVWDLARANSQLRHLASPVTGGGVAISRFHQLFLLGRSQGATSEPEMAAFVWSQLAKQGERNVVNGKVLETAEDNLAHLQNEARRFIEIWLPLLTALQIAPA